MVVGRCWQDRAVVPASHAVYHQRLDLYMAFAQAIDVQTVGERLSQRFEPQQTLYSLRILWCNPRDCLTLCCSTPVYFLRHLGAFGMIGYHCFIGACMPFASVFEWNSCMIFSYFCKHEFALPSSPVLQAFLALRLWFTRKLSRSTRS